MIEPLPSWAWLDPADALDRKRDLERRAYPCRSCQHWTQLWGLEACQKHEGRSGVMMIRCRDYNERGQDEPQK